MPKCRSQPSSTVFTILLFIHLGSIPSTFGRIQSDCTPFSSKQSTNNGQQLDFIKHDTKTRTLFVPRGGGILSFPAGYHPFGYALTDLGSKFLSFEGSPDCDVGRFLASLKSGRKSLKVIKDQWLEVVRVGKKGQSMRIYRTLEDLIALSLKAGFIR